MDDKSLKDKLTKIKVKNQVIAEIDEVLDTLSNNIDEFFKETIKVIIKKTPNETSE